MRERQLIPMEVAGSAVSGAVRLLLEDPDLAEMFWWLEPEWRPTEGTRLFAVAEKGSGIIGLAALSNIRREQRQARLSCAVAAPYRLSGAGHWATLETLRRGVRLEGLRHVEACVPGHNETALRALEALGFRVSETSHEDAPPGGYRSLRLDLPAEPRGPFVRTRVSPAVRALCA